MVRTGGTMEDALGKAKRDLDAFPVQPQLQV
jgi:hypothetical protein